MKQLKRCATIEELVRHSLGGDRSAPFWFTGTRSAPDELRSLASKEYHVFKVACQYAQNWESFKAILCSSLQFPWYQGVNWDAIDESLADVEMWFLAMAPREDNPPFLIIFSEAERMIDFGRTQLTTLRNVFREASNEWLTNQWRDRYPTYCFHVSTAAVTPDVLEVFSDLPGFELPIGSWFPPD